MTAFNPANNEHEVTWASSNTPTWPAGTKRVCFWGWKECFVVTATFVPRGQWESRLHALVGWKSHGKRIPLTLDLGGFNTTHTIPSNYECPVSWCECAGAAINQPVSCSIIWDHCANSGDWTLEVSNCDNDIYQKGTEGYY